MKWILFLLTLFVFSACAATTPVVSPPVESTAEERPCARFHALQDASSFLPGCPLSLRGSELGIAICAAPFIGENDGPFVSPNDVEQAGFRDAMVELLRTRVSTVPLREAFATLGFSVAEVREGPEVFTLVTDAQSCVGGRGTFVFRENPTLDAVIEVPHVGFEQETLSEGFRLFMAGARALAISGSHRCATTVESPCRDGTTGVCGGEPRGYRTSDTAAFHESFFQSLHEAVVTSLPTVVAISLHGKRAKAGVPVVVTSDGTRTEGADTTLSRRVASMLTASGISAGSCQEPSSTLRLCGMSSVQGRVSNGAVDACRDVPTTASGRFLHIEQDYDRIVADIEQPLLDVLRNTLPPISTN